MELENCYTIREEAFMSLHDGVHPHELGFDHFRMYGKWYIYGKSDEAIDAFIKYRKALRESWIFIFATFPFTLPLAIFGLYTMNIYLLLSALLISFVISSIITVICRDNEELKQAFYGNIVVINKKSWTKENC